MIPFFDKDQKFASANKISNSEKKNDYSQHFVNTGERPQNFIRDIRPEERFVGIIFIKKIFCFKICI